MRKAKICIVTGSRAEYGLLQEVALRVAAAEELELQLVATGMHLSPEFGETFREIEADGFELAGRVEMLLSSDSPTGTAKSIGLGLIGFADLLQRLAPQMVVLLGDRFEIAAAAMAAYVARIPLAHIGGGDVTEGAFDESLRHSITKMSQLHFVTNELSRRRVCQLGERPDTVFNVGHPGIDRIVKLPLLTRDELEQALDFRLRRKNVVITYHPATLGSRTAAEEFAQLLAALDALGEETGLLFTRPNADPESRVISTMIDSFVADRPHAKAYASLGQLRYFSAVKAADAVIGNSSSGLCEVPSLHRPTINIGDRQKGRQRGESVIQCEPRAEHISAALERAWTLNCAKLRNPYGDGHSSERIVAELRMRVNWSKSKPKPFYEAGME